MLPWLRQYQIQPIAAAMEGGSPLISAINGAFQTNDTGGWSATWASGTPPTFTPDSAPSTFTLTRAGFTNAGAATTYADTITLTQRVRQPYPSQASLSTNIVALSEVVYQDDVVPGVTNNSPFSSPTPCVNWSMPHRLTVGSTINLEVVAGHRDAHLGLPVACVKFTATDGSLTVSQTITTPAVSARAGDLWAVPAYQCALDISTLATGLITCNAEVYPWFGVSASVAKSVNSSVGREFSPRYFLKNASLISTPYYVYVASTGNDTTGVASTTAALAAAAPCLTLIGALTKANTAASKLDNVQVRIVDTVAHGGNAASNLTQNVAAVIVTRAPGTARAAAILQFGATNTFRPKIATGLTSPLTTGAIRLTDMTINRTGAQTFQGETANELELIFDDIGTFDVGSNNGTWLNHSHDYFFGATITNLSASNSVLAAGTYEHRCWRGVSVDCNAGGMEAFLVLGSTITRPNTLNTGTRTASGSILMSNTISKMTATTCYQIALTADVVNAYVAQNVWEFAGITNTTQFGISNDSATGNTTHIILHNNTFTGWFQNGRSNLFYDEGATGRFNKLMSCKGNIYCEINTKGDVFAGVNQAQPDAATRLGNWQYLYGCGCQGEWSQYIDAASGGLGTSFAQAYPGLGAHIGTSASTPQSPTATMWTNYQGTTGSPTAGAGGGTYSLGASAPVKATVSSAVLPFDLAGTARPTTNDSAGAYAA